MGTFTIAQSPDAADVYLYPDSDTCVDLDRFGDVSNYACVDEDRHNPDDDLTYVYNDTAVMLFDVYGLPNVALSGTVNYVQVYARAKSHLIAQDATGIYKILISPDGACDDTYLSIDIDLITSYSTYVSTWTNNPQTAAAWTLDDIDAMGIGVKCDSPPVTTAALTLTLRPNGVGDLEELESTHHPNWTAVDEAVRDNFTSYVYENAEGTTSTDLYALPDHTTEVADIQKISIFAYIRGPGTTNYARTVIKTQAVNYYGDQEFTDPKLTWILISTDYLINPNTLAAWTWADIDALQGGIEITSTYGSPICTQLYVVVYYNYSSYNPEIRTTQCYAKVNYTPDDIECTLHKPDKIGTNHSRNIKMINFWSGNRVVYDLNRSGKSMVLTGTEYEDSVITDACGAIECIRQQGENGADVTISELGSALWNGVYKIRSFGWKHISECPDVYDWILELEDTRYCQECGDKTYE